MPAYIMVRELLGGEKPSCGDKDCDQMEHQNRVEIGPAILEPFFNLIECLEEVHAEAVKNRHYGDGAASCSYCAAIRAAKRTYKAINGRSL